LWAEFSAVGTFETHVCTGISSNAITDRETEFLFCFWAGFNDNSASFMTGNEIFLEGEGGIFGKDGGEIRVT
jgi:hypothetical protein